MSKEKSWNVKFKKSMGVLGVYCLFVTLCCHISPSFGADSFSSSDLAGTWKAHSIHSSASGWEGWERIGLNIDSSGNFNASWNDSDRDTGTDNGTMSVDSEGVIRMQGADAYQGIMHLDKDLFVMTGDYSDPDSDPFLMVAVKQTGTTFSLSDLAGQWRGYSIYSSDSSSVTHFEGWERNNLTVDNSGNLTGNWNQSDNSAGTIPPGTISIGSDGIITIPDTSYQGIMSPDKNIFIMTGAYSSDPDDDPFFMIAVKQTGASFAQSDLAGEWQAHSISSSASGWEGWNRIDLTTGESGSFSASWTDSDKDSGTDSGNLTLTANGYVSRAGEASSEGVMCADKRLFIVTEGYEGSNDDPQLTIFVLRSNSGQDGGSTDNGGDDGSSDTGGGGGGGGGGCFLHTLMNIR